MLKRLQKWFKKFFNTLSELVIAFIVTVLGYAFILSFFRMLWALYRETEVGHRFQAGNEPVFNAINGLIHQNPLLFSCSISYGVAKICLLIAFISQLFLLKRWFYDPRGSIGRILLWGLPCSFITALYLQGPFVNVMFAFCLLPCLALFTYCFKFVSQVVPGLDDFF